MDRKILIMKQKYIITPEHITTLADNEIFVFGSNLAGHHAGGAARTARKYFGAISGQGVGLQGQSYAIPTMQGPLETIKPYADEFITYAKEHPLNRFLLTRVGGVETIKPYVDEFILFAKEHKEQTFLVTRIGCGIAGFKDEEIAPLFKDALELDNVALPESFFRYLSNM